MNMIEENNNNTMEERVGTNIPMEMVEEEEKQFYPRKVEQPFITKKLTFGQKLIKVFTLGIAYRKKKIIANPKMKQPILLLIKDDGYTDFIEGVKKGMFIINMKDGKQKGIMLSPNKLTTLNIEPFPKVWIAYENEMTPYPLDIYHDGEEALSIIRKIETNRDLLKDQAKLINAKMMFWVAVIGIILVGLYFAISNGWLDAIFSAFKG